MDVPEVTEGEATALFLCNTLPEESKLNICGYSSSKNLKPPV